jgi:hypothetical protein
VLCSLFLSACDERPLSSDQQQRVEQERLSQQSNQSVGMPAITNFQEKRMLKMILELRDTQIATITYTQDLAGHLHKLCQSVGYGVPYATQYTNPQRVAYSDGHGFAMALPQADPNGLFSPAAAEGTWVLCLDQTNKKKVAPVYVEPRIIVSPFPLQSE